MTFLKANGQYLHSLNLIKTEITSRCNITWKLCCFWVTIIIGSNPIILKFESSLIGKILNFKFNKNGSKPLIRAMLLFITNQILSFLVIVLAILVSVAYLTLAERKLMGSMQQRTGPNVVGFFGLLQPLADGLKLLLKESVIPTNANTFGFVLAPIMTLLLSLFG